MSDKNKLNINKDVKKDTARRPSKVGDRINNLDAPLKLKVPRTELNASFSRQIFNNLNKSKPRIVSNDNASILLNINKDVKKIQHLDL